MNSSKKKNESVPYADIEALAKAKYLEKVGKVSEEKEETIPEEDIPEENIPEEEISEEEIKDDGFYESEPAETEYEPDEYAEPDLIPLKDELQSDGHQQKKPSHRGIFNKVNIMNALRYFVLFAVILIYWEFILAFKMGGFSASTLFLLFFIPAQAAFFTALCGFGNRLSSHITYPVILLIPAVYYAVQMVYLTNFGSLFSISMTGMGTDAVGDFGWAVTDSIIESIPVIILILLPVILAAAVSVITGIRGKKADALHSHDQINDADVNDADADIEISEGTDKNKTGLWSRILKLLDPCSYKLVLHAVVLVLSVLLWFAGIGGIRLFGSERPSPYYLFTSSQATTELSAKKLGVLTTALVESGSYYFGMGQDEDTGFSYEEEEFEVSDAEKSSDDEIKVLQVGEDETETESEPEIERVPWTNDALDFDLVLSTAEDDETKELAEFFSKRKPSETNEYTGMFEGYNLIYICAESFWSYACNEEVTPTLYKMAHGGIVLNNYYNSFLNTTTNGEYAFDTSLWPDVSRNSKNGTDVGSFAQSAAKYMPQGLGDLFTAQGIPSYAFHNYYGKYYRRILSWPNLGYKCRFTGDGMWFTMNWPASDLELMEQTVDDYINDDQFHAYYMTFSGHGPYTSKNQMFNKNIDEVTSAVGEDKYNIDARGYFAGELELDKAMEYLLKRLEEAGKLDNTVIVIAGDHYPYYLSDEGRTSLVGYDIDQNFDIYKSNCIIYNAGMEPMEVDSYCSNIDIAPTILNLFNIPFDSRLMMGRDIFSEQAHNRGTLYNMSFITDLVRYNYETGEAQWTDEGNKLSDADKDKYIKSQLQNIENEYNASNKIIDDNFFLKAYTACGLLTEQEIADENAREESVRSQDNNYNAEDEEEKLERELEKQQEEEAAAAQLLLEQMQNGTIPDATAVPQDGTAVQTTDAATDANAAAQTPAAATDTNAAAQTPATTP